MQEILGTFKDVLANEARSSMDDLIKKAIANNVAKAAGGDGGIGVACPDSGYGTNVAKDSCCDQLYDGGIQHDQCYDYNNGSSSSSSDSSDSDAQFPEYSCVMFDDEPPEVDTSFEFESDLDWESDLTFES